MAKLALILLLFSSLFAESYENTYARFAEVARFDEIIASSLDEKVLLESIEMQFNYSGISVNDDIKKNLVTIVQETLQEAKPEFEQYFFETYKKYFSQDDLLDLIAFYQTEVGDKLIELNIFLTQSSFKTSEDILSKYYPAMIEKIQKLLESTK